MNLNFNCTYHTNNNTDEVYQNELLLALQSKDIDDLPKKLFDDLYDEIKCKEIDVLLDGCAKNYIYANDKIIQIMILFSWDYFYLFHGCLKDLKKNIPFDKSSNYKLLYQQLYNGGNEKKSTDG